MRQSTQDDFELILDCFAGYDSGISFVDFRAFIEDVAKQADKGNESADKILIMMFQFANLIRISCGKDKIRE